MSKKNFRADIATGADRFFSVNDIKATEAIKDTQTTQNTKAVKDTPAMEKYYRLNLKLRAEYKDFLADEAWRQRISITELLNRMIGEYKERLGE